MGFIHGARDGSADRRKAGLRDHRLATLAASLADQAARALKEAKSNDGQEDPPETLGDFELLASRFPGGGW